MAQKVASNQLDSNTQGMLYSNAIINSGCLISQRSATAPTLSTTSQYGKVDRFRAHATGTAVSAGTVNQITTSAAGTSGYALHISGATITGTGVVIARYRMEAKDAIQFKNGIGSFGVKVWHDVGSTINYTIIIRTPTTTADDFSATTTIVTSASLPVATSTATTIKFENQSLGDVSKGIEIEIQAACGAVTTKNFHFAEWQFNNGNIALTWLPRSYGDELRSCMRYYQENFIGGLRLYVSNVWRYVEILPVPFRVTPTTVKSNGGVAGLAADNSAGVQTGYQWDLQFTAGGVGVIDFTSYTFKLDAEL